MLEIEVGLPTPPPSSPTYLTTKRPTQRCCLLYLALVLLVLLVLLTSFTTPSHSGLYPPPPDYNRFSSWAAHPTKADDADVVPAECGQNNQATATIDVFYVYPTSFSSNDMQHMNAPINDGQATVLSDAGSLNQQASAFNGVGKIYAPRYRQVSQQGQGSQGQWNNLPRDKNTPLQLAMDVAFTDVLEAFLHYMKVFNDDRPFIIASHSQGTMHAKRLIKYIDAQIHSADGDLAQWMKIKNQIIAAYLIGNTISKENEMPSWLPMCRTPTATKCFVSWNTFVKGSNRDLGAVHWLSKLQQYNMSLNVDQQSYRNLSCACTNPFSWRNDTLNSNSSLHYGSFGLLGSLFLWNFKSRELTVRCDEQDGMLYVDPDPSVLYGWQYSTSFVTLRVCSVA
jgi:hypothetical protein